MVQDEVIMSDEQIALCNRIKEFLVVYKQEKGDAFSIRAFSKRIGMKYETFRKICAVKRPARPSEQEKIAQGLGVTVERLKGEDTQKQLEELDRLLSNRVNMKRAIEIAGRLESVVIGYTEKFTVLNDLGTACYYFGAYEKAESAWLRALEVARSIEKYLGERVPLFKASSNILLVYNALRNFQTLRQLLDKTDESMEQLPPRYAGTLQYSLAEVAKSVNDINDYKRKTYESLHYFRLTNERRLIGKAEFRVGEAEFELGNYSAALEYAGLSMEHLEDQEDIKYFPRKNYAKALLKLGEVEKAVELIQASISELSTLNQPNLLAKFLLLHATATNDIQSAERVLQFEDKDGTLHQLACQSLMSQYSKLDDSTNVMKYYRIAERIKQSSATWEVI